jgi:hypothetical protein
MRISHVCTLLVAAAGAFAALAASAHHAAAVLFLLDQEVEVEGVVTRFNLGNPHVRVYFRMTGDEQEWMAEGGSRTVLLRNGWSEDMLKPGDTVKIVGHPSRDGSAIMHMEYLHMPDGRALWSEDVPPPDQLEQMRRRR